MSKCIIFSRVSTTQQTLEAQTEALIKEAKNNGYKESDMIIIEQKESAIKLDIEEREGIRRLKEKIEADNDIDCVYIWEPSRLSRRSTVLFMMRDYFIEKQIQLIIMKPYMRLLEDGKMSQTASLLFSLFSALSESEMTIKIERFMRAKNKMKEEGKKNCGGVIFGYMKDKDKKIVPHQIYSKVIIDMFNYYVNNEDVSYYETYMWLVGKYGDIFKIKGYVDYVKAQKKIQHLFQQKIYGEGNWCYMPLVSKELYDKAREKASKRQSKARYYSKLELLGRGKCRCGICGNIMIGCGGNVQGYVCTTDKDHSMQIGIKYLDFIIWEETKSLINVGASLNNKEKLLELNNKKERNDNMIKEMKVEVENKNIKNAKLLDLYLENKINKEIWEGRTKEIEDDINILNEKIEKLIIQNNEIEAAISNDNEKNKVFVNVEDIKSFETKLEYVRKYIKYLTVNKLENKELLIEAEYNGCFIVPKVKYLYKNRKIWRINEDGTKDWIW